MESGMTCRACDAPLPVAAHGGWQKVYCSNACRVKWQRMQAALR